MYFDFPVALGSNSSPLSKRVPIRFGISGDTTRRTICFARSSRSRVSPESFLAALPVVPLRSDGLRLSSHCKLPRPTARIQRQRPESCMRRKKDNINNSNFHPLDGDSFRGLVSLSARTGQGVKRAGQGGLKPHDLRRTAANLRRNNGASIEDVFALLSHRSIATTVTCLARMEGEEDNGWRELADNFTVEFILRWSGCSQP